MEIKSLYFVDECPGRGSENIKKEYNLKLKRTETKQKNKKYIHPGKELEAP